MGGHPRHVRCPTGSATGIIRLDSPIIVELVTPLVVEPGTTRFISAAAHWPTVNAGWGTALTQYLGQRVGNIHAVSRGQYRLRGPLGGIPFAVGGDAYAIGTLPSR